MSRDPALARLKARVVADWWRDAKFGIFVHWTMASVPAYAPTGDEIGDLMVSRRRDAFAHSPYVEWYQNSLRFADSPVATFHREHYGDAPYENFREPFEAGIAAWDPTRWAEAFAAAGARYVVLVAKHADGYCLWPTDVDNPRRPGWHSQRDVVGELATAVRAAGLRFGLYYSGGMDWTFCDWPIGTLADVVAAIPRGEYAAYADAQVRELVARYEPSVLWNDIAWPGPGRQLWRLFEDYYAAVPEGVVNDRWLPWSAALGLSHVGLGRRLIDAASRRQARSDGGLVPPRPPHFDVRTPEYMTFERIQRTPWECVRGMDASFGYNEHSSETDFISHGDLQWLVSDITAKGGNLLLNVGPRGVDGSIPKPQATRLAWCGEFLADHGAALYDTRPWTTPGTGDVRYTRTDTGVGVLVRHPGPGVLLPGLAPGLSMTIRTPSGEPVPWRARDGGVEVDLVATNGAVSLLVVDVHDAAALDADAP